MRSARASTLGVAFTIWHASDASAYDQMNCASTRPVTADCLSRYDDIDTAQALQVTSFALAGAFTVGVVTLWFLDRRAAPRSPVAARGCTLFTPGVRCLF